MMFEPVIFGISVATWTSGMNNVHKTEPTKSNQTERRQHNKMASKKRFSTWNYVLNVNEFMVRSYNEEW